MDITIRILNKVTDTQGMHRANPSDKLFRSNVTNTEAMVQTVRFNSTTEAEVTFAECFLRTSHEVLTRTQLQANLRGCLGTAK